MDEKIDLIKANRHRYGLNACLRAVGLSKGTWHYRQRRRSGAQGDAALKAEIVSVIESHPGYGFRRIQAELKARLSRPINHKRLRRVLNQYDLGLRRCLPAASRSPVVSMVAQASARLVKGRSFGTLEAFSTDFTELFYAGGQRKAYLMVLLWIESFWGRFKTENADLLLGCETLAEVTSMTAWCTTTKLGATRRLTISARWRFFYQRSREAISPRSLSRD